MKILRRNDRQFYVFASILFIVCFHCQEIRGADDEGRKTNEKADISNWDARLDYARLLSNLQRYDDALVQYRLLLNEKPNSIDVQIEMAQVFYYQGEYQQALQILEKIPKKDLTLKTLTLIADINVAAKNYTEAESIYRDLLEKSPDDDLTKLKLAELLSWQGKYQESIFFYRQILKNNPDDMQVRRKYAMVLMWMGKEKEAAEEMEKTLQ